MVFDAVRQQHHYTLDSTVARLILFVSAQLLYQAAAARNKAIFHFILAFAIGF